jgi:hypothetical protein
MPAWICVTCGAEFAPSTDPPAGCPICLDERQYVGAGGQRWTHHHAMLADGFRNEIREHEPGLHGIGTKPSFGTGQRALLIQTPGGNVLWDCVHLLDVETVTAIELLGGIRAIAISHPHFYTGMVEWAEHFDARIYLPEADRRWVTRPTEHISFWSGNTLSLPDSITIIRLGGHFAGGAVLHWPNGADGRGALLTGDTIQVVADPRWISFMYSYPNLIPLPTSTVTRIADAALAYEFDRIYGGWFDKVVPTGAREVVRRSAERYVAALRQRRR